MAPIAAMSLKQKMAVKSLCPFQQCLHGLVADFGRHWWWPVLLDQPVGIDSNDVGRGRWESDLSRDFLDALPAIIRVRDWPVGPRMNAMRR